MFRTFGHVMIEIETKEATDKLRQLHKDLTDTQFKKAVSRAINHTANRLNTATSREIRKVYNIKHKDLGKITKIVPSSPSTLTAYIKADTGTLGIGNFGAKEIRVEKARQLTWYSSLKTRAAKFKKGRRVYGKAVQVEVLKGNKQTLRQTWLRSFSSARKAVFARGRYGPGGFEWGGNRNEFRSLKTKSPFYAILNPTVSKNLMEVASDKYQERLIHEITKGLRHAK